MHLLSSSSRGGPRAVGGGIGDFVGILQHICAPVVGEMKGLWFITPQTTGKYGDFASAKAQGNWERAFIVLYAVNQPWGTFTVNVLEKKNNKNFIFCQTISKTKRVNRTKLLFWKYRGKRGN